MPIGNWHRIGLDGVGNKFKAGKKVPPKFAPPSRLVSVWNDSQRFRRISIVVTAVTATPTRMRKMPRIIAWAATILSRSA